MRDYDLRTGMLSFRMREYFRLASDCQAKIEATLVSEEDLLLSFAGIYMGGENGIIHTDKGDLEVNGGDTVTLTHCLNSPGPSKPNTPEVGSRFSRHVDRIHGWRRK